jgi:hypothetical protein
MNFAQHTLFGMVCSHLVNEFQYDPCVEEALEMQNLIVELDENGIRYDELTHSESIEVYPENVYEIFQSFYLVNEDTILELASENNSNIKEIL